MRRWAALIALVIALVMEGGTPRAYAYVRSTTTDGRNQLYWKASCVPLTIYPNGFDDASRTPHLPLDQIVKSIAAAARTWGPDASCKVGGTTTHPYLEIVPSLATVKTAGPVGYDARNTLVFRTENWTMGGKPAGPNVVAYDNDALAVTSVIARGDGHIVDVDMEINGVNKQWVNLDPGVVFTSDPHLPDDTFYDLQNALTHEFGHLIGLDHTCFLFDASNPKARPKDDLDMNVPFCDGSESLDVRNTVMYYQSDSRGETSKRRLAPDDNKAVCEIYPASKPNDGCRLDQPNTGCAVAAPGPAGHSRVAPWAAFAVVGTALAVVVRRHRRARRC